MLSSGIVSDNRDPLQGSKSITIRSTAFGLTHNPRPEDFPVMPVEMLRVGLKPSGFFEKNRKYSRFHAFHF
jgi:Cu2+-containing amine oxidase